jgi:hypothetical protein
MIEHSDECLPMDVGQDVARDAALVERLQERLNADPEEDDVNMSKHDPAFVGLLSCTDAYCAFWSSFFFLFFSSFLFAAHFLKLR